MGKVSKTYDRKENTLYYWYYHVFLTVMNNSYLHKKNKIKWNKESEWAETLEHDGSTDCLFAFISADIQEFSPVDLNIYFCFKAA